MHSSYDRVEVIFSDHEGRELRRTWVMLPYGSKWSPEQIESVARLQLKEYGLRATVVGKQYQATPIETKAIYDMNEMGFALWCKVGKHAFDPEDKGRKRIQFTDYSEDVPRDMVAWACSEHAPDFGNGPKKEVGK
jgi:hypothetical protein